MKTGEIKKEYDEVLEQLSSPGLISNWPTSAKAAADKEKFEELIKRKVYLEKVIEKDKELQDIKSKVDENKSIISAGEDSELVALAETEILQLQEKKKLLEKELEALAKGEEREEGPRSVIVEIRAGTGGKEAALFAGDLFKMYSKYGQAQGWQQKVLDSHPSELGGFKEIIFELKNKDVYSKMKHEGGVHRVQRIPETEKTGRIHTSTASVAVLPKPKGTEIKISPKDLKIDVYKSSGPGGQYVNKRMTAVRITYLPSGTVVTSQTERNLQQNKENAMSVLEAKLLEKEVTAESEKLGEKRKAQIKGAQRADKIRTYNFPQDRVTDHRLKKSWYNIEEIMAGRLDHLIKALQKALL